jgi:hypothetical protein
MKFTFLTLQTYDCQIIIIIFTQNYIKYLPFVRLMNEMQTHEGTKTSFFFWFIQFS